VSGTAHVVVALAVVAAGFAVVVWAGPIAAALLRARLTARRSGSLLNADRTDRLIAALGDPGARRLERWLVRGFGALLVLGGALALVS
jgi:hypothetical protein